MGKAVVNQTHYRGRYDDGSQTGATWIANTNTDWSQEADVIFRVRFALQESAGGSASQRYELHYSYNSGTYAIIPTSGGVINPVASADTSWTITDGDATTQQITSGLGTFAAGEMVEDQSTNSNISLDLDSTEYTEIEWVLQINSGAVTAGDTIELQVYVLGGTAIDSYTTPTITVAAGAETIATNELTLASSPQAVDIKVNQTVATNELTLASSPQTTTITRAETIPFDELTLASSPQATIVTKPVITNTLSLVSSAGASLIIRDIVTSSLTLTGSAETTTVVTIENQTVTVNTLTLAGSTETTTIFVDLTVTVNTLTLTGSPETTTIQTISGPTVGVNTLTLTGTAESAAPAQGEVTIKTVRVNANTTTGTQDIISPGVGFPKAALFFLVRADVDATEDDHAGTSFGFTDGVSQYTQGQFLDDNVSSATDNTGITSNNASVIRLRGPLGTVEAVAEFDSWIPGGVRIDWTTAPPDDWFITTTLVGGPDVTAAAGNNETNSTDSDTLDVDVGFEPDLCFFMSNNANPDWSDDTDNGHVSFGVASNQATIEQACFSSMWSMPSITDIVQYVDNSRIDADITIVGVRRTTELTSFNPGPTPAAGFTITNRIGTAAVNSDIAWLALNFNSVTDSCVEVSTSPATTGETTSTTPAFQPQSLLVIQSLADSLATLEDQIGSVDGYSLGIADQSNQYTALSPWTLDVQSTSNTTSFSESGTILRVKNGSEVIGVRGNLSEYTANGYTIDWTTTTSSSRYYIAVTIEKDNTPAQSQSVQVNTLTLTGSAETISPFITEGVLVNTLTLAGSVGDTSVDARTKLFINNFTGVPSGFTSITGGAGSISASGGVLTLDSGGTSTSDYAALVYQVPLTQTSLTVTWVEVEFSGDYTNAHTPNVVGLYDSSSEPTATSWSNRNTNFRVHIEDQLGSTASNSRVQARYKNAAGTRGQYVSATDVWQTTFSATKTDYFLNARYRFAVVYDGTVSPVRYRVLAFYRSDGLRVGNSLVYDSTWIEVGTGTTQVDAADNDLWFVFGELSNDHNAIDHQINIHELAIGELNPNNPEEFAWLNSAYGDPTAPSFPFPYQIYKYINPLPQDQGLWITRYRTHDNPEITYGTDDWVKDPHVYDDTEYSGKYYMVYQLKNSGADSDLYICETTDLINGSWTNHTQVSVPGAGDAKHEFPYLTREPGGGDWYLFYGAESDTPSWRIEYKTSTNSTPYSGWSSATTALNTGGSGAFDDDGCTGPNLIWLSGTFTSGTFILTYAGTTNSGGPYVWNTGMAVSTTGITGTYTKSSNSPFTDAGTFSTQVDGTMTDVETITVDSTSGLTAGDVLLNMSTGSARLQLIEVVSVDSGTTFSTNLPITLTDNWYLRHYNYYSNVGTHLTRINGTWIFYTTTFKFPAGEESFIYYIETTGAANPVDGTYRAARTTDTAFDFNLPFVPFGELPSDGTEIWHSEENLKPGLVTLTTMGVIAVDTLTLTGSAEDTTVDAGGAVQVTTNTLTLTATPQTATVTREETVTVNTLTLTAAPQAIQINQTVPVNTLTLAGSAETTNVARDESITVNTLTATLSPQVIQINQTVPVNSLTLASSVETTTITRAETLTVNELTLTTAPQTTTITRAEMITTNELILTGSAETIQINQTVPTNTLTLVGSAETTNVARDETVATNELTLTGSAETVAVGNIVSIQTNTITLTGSAETTNIARDETITVNELTLTAAPQTVQINQTVPVNTLTLVGSPETATITRAETITVNELTLATAPQTTTITRAETITTNTLTLTGSAETVQINQTVPVSTLTLTSSAEIINVARDETTTVNTLTLVGSAEFVDVGNLVSVATNTLTLAGSAETINVDAPITITTGTLTLAGSAETTQVSQALYAATLTLTSSVQGILIGQTVLTSTLTLASSAETIAVTREETITVNTLTLTAAPQTVQIDQALYASTLTLTGSAESITIVIDQTVQTNTLTLTGSPETVAVGNLVGVDVTSLTLTGSAETINVNAPITITTSTLTLTSSAEITNVTREETVTVSTLTLVGSPETVTVIPGTATTTMTTPVIASQPQTTNVAVDEIITTNELTLVGSAEAVTIIPGEATVQTNTLTLTGSVEATTIFVGQTIQTSTLTLTGSAEAIEIGQTVVVNTLTLIGSPETITATAVANEIPFNTLTLTGSAETATVVATTTIQTSTLTLASTIEATTLATGATSVTVNTLTLVGSAETTFATVGGVGISTSTLTLASSPEAITAVGGAISVTTSTLNLTGSAETINVYSIVVITTTTLTLASSVETTTVVPGEYTVTSSELTLASSAESITIGQTVLFTEVTLVGSAETTTVVSIVSVTTSTLTLVGSPETATVLPGEIIVTTTTTTLVSSPETATIVPGEALMTMTTPVIASSAEAATVYPLTTIGTNTLTLAGTTPQVNIALSVFVISVDTLELSSEAVQMLMVPGGVGLLMSTLSLASASQLSYIVPGNVGAMVGPNGGLVGPQGGQVGYYYYGEFPGGRRKRSMGLGAGLGSKFLLFGVRRDDE